MQHWKNLSVAETEQFIVTLTMNRPASRNAISVEMADEMESCLRYLHARNDVRALVLTGAGSAFGSGADLKERAVLTAEKTQAQRDTVLRFIDLLENFPCPVIAMINGPAIAGAFEIALACDIRVASDRALFGLPEVSKVGAFPGAGGPVRLAKLVGRGRANYVVLTGRQFGAAEAFALGLVEVVVPHDRLAAETLSLAQQICANSPEGVRAAKQLILQSTDLDLAASMKLSKALRNPLDGTTASREGINAWMEKRNPDFQEVEGARK